LVWTKLWKDGKASLVNESLLSSNIWTELSQQTNSNYSVSYFEKNPFYWDEYTYTYWSHITTMDEKKIVWWIWIIFDSLPQFKQMLLDILPKKDWKIIEWTFWLYTDKYWKVISSTKDDIIIWSIYSQVPKSFFDLKNGESISDILTLWSTKYIVWASCSKGYREYKNSDGYKNDIICLVFIRI
jgi:hypothetical protein